MLDGFLVAILVIVLPGYMFWKSLATRGKSPQPKIRRYTQSLLVAVVLVGLLTFQWVRTGRSFVSLGLDMPVSVRGLVGLGLAVCILVAIAAAMVARPDRISSEGGPGKEIMPETRGEMMIFVVFSLVVGCSWEILYRGFLLWVLPPHMGLFAAIIVAAGAYGIAHGFKSTKMFVGGILSAFIFTIAFAVTRSLWWLMLVHCGIPMVGALIATWKREVLLPPGAPSEGTSASSLTL